MGFNKSEMEQKRKPKLRIRARAVVRVTNVVTIFCEETPMCTVQHTTSDYLLLGWSSGRVCKIKGLFESERNRSSVLGTN
jgi:hypothetical protein